MKSLSTFATSMLIIMAYLCAHAARSQSFQTEYLRYLSEVRSGKQIDPPTNLLAADNQISNLLTLIEENLADTQATVRRACYHTLHVAQQNSMDLNVKRQILKMQLNGLYDPVPNICGFTISNISILSSDVFNDDQKTVVADFLKKPVPNKAMLIKIAGSLNIKQSIPVLQQLALPGNPSEERWAAFMALSRMGNEDAISYTDRRLRNLSSQMVVSLAPAVIYTRQKQLYDYLVELLYSNNDCGTKEVENERKPVSCAYEILEELAPVIQGFPINTATLSGELSTHDHDQALKIAQKWFTQNPDYQIIAGK